MTPVARSILLTALVVVPVTGADRLSQTTDGHTLTLGVDGRSNQTPWVGAAGNTVAVAWGASVDGKTDVFVAISHDGGRRFEPPRRVNTIPGEARLGGESPPRVELRDNDDAPEVVVLWTARGAVSEIKLSRSLDGGRSFAAPLTLQTSGAAGDRGWPSLALDATGTAHVVWLDHRGLAAGADAHAHHRSGEYDGVAMAQRSGLYYRAAGATTLPERELTPGVCYCCKTALAVSPDGALYAAWRHVYPGNIRDIAFTVSRDRGRSFSPPTRVSEDRWQLNGCPDDGPAVAVDRSGTVHVIWPTVLQGTEPQGALFYATSRDGRTFTPRVRVPAMGSPRPSHPHIVVDDRGAGMVAWDEVADGTRTAFARSFVRARDGAARFEEPLRLDTTGPSMYPVIARAEDAHIVVWTSGRPGHSVIRVRRIEDSGSSGRR